MTQRVAPPSPLNSFQPSERRIYPSSYSAAADTQSSKQHSVRTTFCRFLLLPVSIIIGSRGKPTGNVISQSSPGTSLFGRVHTQQVLQPEKRAQQLLKIISQSRSNNDYSTSTCQSNGPAQNLTHTHKNTETSSLQELPSMFRTR